MSDILKPHERIAILSKRLWSLRQGKGDHTPAERDAETISAQIAMHETHSEQRRQIVKAGR